ncbi:serine hydrolase domain-containing protein [Amycolatopsis sp. NPDC024027]|uniref:serine hydrolase domain-containing protein n=1 Tax=Amycolatopsis sp. NPDC024027 TaxID=3154327 RepID=UPI00340DCD75
MTSGFEGVREEFAAAVAEEAGAQLAVYAHGRLVVDLWTGDEVTGDTLTGVYSSTKGAATLVVALLVQDGVLELDRPVAGYWPEFAAAGQGPDHRAGSAHPPFGGDRGRRRVQRRRTRR